MPGQTAGGLPYPLPTEPVRDGAVAIRNLAEAVDARTSAGGMLSTGFWNQATDASGYIFCTFSRAVTTAYVQMYGDRSVSKALPVVQSITGNQVAVMIMDVTNQPWALVNTPVMLFVLATHF